MTQPGWPLNIVTRKSTGEVGEGRRGEREGGRDGERRQATGTALSLTQVAYALDACAPCVHTEYLHIEVLVHMLHSHGVVVGLRSTQLHYERGEEVGTERGGRDREGGKATDTAPSLTQVAYTLDARAPCVHTEYRLT